MTHKRSIKKATTNTNRIFFKNGDLQISFRNELSSDDFKMKKSKIDDDGEGNPTWFLDFNETSYSYAMRKDRDHDYKLMRQCIKKQKGA